MAISVRLRRDFTVTDADRLLATARRMYLELNPGAGTVDAATMVTCAADALFVVLEHAGLIGDTADGRLAGHVSDGLAVAGWRADVTVNEPNPLPTGRDCLRTGDVFALPPRAPTSPETCTLICRCEGAGVRWHGDGLCGMATSLGVRRSRYLAVQGPMSDLARHLEAESRPNPTRLNTTAAGHATDDQGGPDRASRPASRVPPGTATAAHR